MSWLIFQLGLSADVGH